MGELGGSHHKCFSFHPLNRGFTSVFVFLQNWQLTKRGNYKSSADFLQIANVLCKKLSDKKRDLHVTNMMWVSA